MQVAVANAEAGKLDLGLEILGELIEWAEACGFDPLDIVKRLVRMRS